MKHKIRTQINSNYTALYEHNTSLYIVHIEYN